MKKFLIGAFALTAMIAAAQAQTPTEIYGQTARSFSLATDGPGDLGLLKLLGERYARDVGCGGKP